MIGDAVNEAARLCELAKDRPGLVLASGAATDAAAEVERGRWDEVGSQVVRGRDEPTRLCAPADAADTPEAADTADGADGADSR